MSTPSSSAGMPADTNELIRRRKEKLDAWRGRGIEPFGGRFPVTHKSGELQTRYREAPEDALKDAGLVGLAGRVIALRDHGKTCFADLQDQSGKIQLYARADALGDQYASFSDIDVAISSASPESSSGPVRASCRSRSSSSSSSPRRSDRCPRSGMA